VTPLLFALSSIWSYHPRDERVNQRMLRPEVHHAQRYRRISTTIKLLLSFTLSNLKHHPPPWEVPREIWHLDKPSDDFDSGRRDNELDLDDMKDRQVRTGTLESSHHQEDDDNILRVFIIETRLNRPPEYSTKGMLSISFRVCFEALKISAKTPLALHALYPFRTRDHPCQLTIFST